MRINYVLKLRQDYATQIILELRHEVTLDLRYKLLQKTTLENYVRTRSLVVSDLRSKTKGSRFESVC